MHLVDLKAHQMMGFSFIGVLMDDLITAAATIHAAQIQANYTLWAASISSIVGAVGIIFAAWYAWQSGIKLHQHNNIIEAKREVYLEAIANYHELMNCLSMINVIPNQFFELFLNNSNEFSKSINKVSLICESKNKKLVSDFSENVGNQIVSLIPTFEIFLEVHNSVIKSKEKVQIASEKVDKYASDNIIPSQFDEIDGDLIEKIIAEFEIAADEFQKNYSNFKDAKNTTEEKVQSIVGNLFEESQTFSSALRAELKIDN